MTVDGNNDVVGSFFHRIFLLVLPGIHFSSERLVQEYKTGDNRLDKNFYLNTSPYPANISSRVCSLVQDGQ